MLSVLLAELDTASVESTVGIARFVQGMRYVRQHAISHVDWAPAEGALHGVVRGQSGELHTATAYLASSGPRYLSFDRGQCSCLVRDNCSHAVALALAVASDTAADTDPAAGLSLTATANPAGSMESVGSANFAAGTDRMPAQLAVPRQAAIPRQATPLSLAPPPGSATAPPAAPPDTAWARSFDTILGIRVPAPASPPGNTPLAIEVALTGLSQGQIVSQLSNPTPPKVVARLVQAGKNGGWIAGRVGWNRLDSLRFDRAFSPAQVRLVQEILAAYRSSSSYSSGYYASYGHAADKTLDLSSFESRQLWPLLDEASAVGLQLVYPRKLGIIDQYREAEFCLDITRSSADDLTVTPALRIAGAAAKARIIRFIGSDGHGVVYADPAETENRDPADWRFRLARLTAPVPRSLQQLAEAGQRLEVRLADALSS